MFRLPLLVLLSGCVALALPNPVRADSNATVAAQLSNNDVYITNNHLPAGVVRSGDLRRLQTQVNSAAGQNVDEKIAIVSTYPSNFRNITQAASSLQNFLDYSGVLILVSPKGMGISSDLISNSAITGIVRRSSPMCAHGYAGCAVLAGRLAVPAVRSAKNNAFHDAIVLIIASVVGLGALIGVLSFAIFRRRRVTTPIPT